MPLNSFCWKNKLQKNRIAQYIIKNKNDAFESERNRQTQFIHTQINKVQVLIFLLFIRDKI